jgi:NSS family neurotransmitter:Na+ symporter
MGTNMLIGGLALIIIFQYACLRIKHDSVWTRGERLNVYGFCLRYLVPAVLGIILIGNLLQEFQSFDVAKGVRWTWFVTALFTAWMLTRLAAKRSSISAYAKIT